MSGLLSDVRYVLRTLRQSPAFAAIAIGSLAIGIGANTAVFSVIRSLLLDPLPVEKPEELALVYWSSPSQSKALSYTELAGGSQEDRATGVKYQSNYSYPAYLTLTSLKDSGTEIFGFNFVPNVVVSIDDQPAVIVGGAVADGRYFSVLSGRRECLRRVAGVDRIQMARRRRRARKEAARSNRRPRRSRDLARPARREDRHTGAARSGCGTA